MIRVVQFKLVKDEGFLYVHWHCKWPIYLQYTLEKDLLSRMSGKINSIQNNTERAVCVVKSSNIDIDHPNHTSTTSICVI